MLRLIFKTILFIFILIVVIVSLIIWKGGEPFRWTGENIEIVGKAIERFGDRINEIKKGGEKAKNKLREFKENFGSDKLQK